MPKKPKGFTQNGIKFKPVTEESLKWLGRRYKARFRGKTHTFNTKKEAVDWAKHLLTKRKNV